MDLRIVPFVPGRRPTDEEAHPGLGSSDNAALLIEESQSRAVLLFEVTDLPPGGIVEATVTIDDEPLRGWTGRRLDLTSERRQRVEIEPSRDLAGIDLGFSVGFMRSARVELTAKEGSSLASDEASLDVCAVRNIGSLYERLIERLLVTDTTSQARRAGVPDPGVAYHPWFPVLRIGGEKAALYKAALVADIVDKHHFLTDPAWLLRVGVFLELLTCLGIVEAVKDEVGDLLEPGERSAFEESEAFADIRWRIDPDSWRKVWDMRQIAFPNFTSPSIGPVSGINLLRKKNATLRFLHTHHEDLKGAIEMAGANMSNSQETWQRVFRDAERAVLRKTAEAFPELSFVPAPARQVILWQPFSLAGQEGLYTTACNQYRASMNLIARWAKARGLMDYAGSECVPRSVSLLEAYLRDSKRLAMLQRQDGLSPNLTVTEPVADPKPTTQEIERQLADVSILSMLSADDIHTLAMGVRPLLLGPTERLLVEGYEGTSMFLISEGMVEVRLRKADGTDRLVETLGPGEVLGEMALLTGERRAATVRSVDETLVLEIGRELYKPILKAHPEWLEELATLMDKRLARRRVLMAEPESGSKVGFLFELIRKNFFG